MLFACTLVFLQHLLQYLHHFRNLALITQRRWRRLRQGNQRRRWIFWRRWEFRRGWNRLTMENEEKKVNYLN
jgi:hypothetical protein